MPLQLPNLDDRTYDDLVQEALSLIPGYAPEWTNYNPSDPGITLIELFAYITEMLLYRQNQVTNANKQAFLNLLTGLESNEQKKYPTPLDEQTLNQEVGNAIQALRQVDRAVTRKDFEHLALRSSPQVARAYCVPRRNLQSENPLIPEEKAGHISVVVVSQAADLYRVDGNTIVDYTDEASTISGNPVELNRTPTQFLYVGLKIPFTGLQFRMQTPGEGYTLHLDYFNGSEWIALAITDGTSNWTTSGLIQFALPPDWTQTTVNGATNYWLRLSSTTTSSQVATALQVVPQHDVLQQVATYLEPRRLLTTKVHVVEPRYFPIRVQITLMLKPDAKVVDVQRGAIRQLQRFFHPLKGGPDGGGWSFGRDVYVSEIYELLDQLPGVDYVRQSSTTTGEVLDEVMVINPLDSDRRRLNNQGQLVALAIGSSELVDARIQLTDITVLPPPKTTATLASGDSP